MVLGQERARIARDIHDHLGADLTQIAVRAEDARQHLDHTSPASGDVAQLAHASRQAVDTLDELVWATSPRSDSLESLVSYLGEFVANFLETHHLRCELDFPVTPPALNIGASVRHNLFLALKECLHNVARHAGATTVEVTLKISEAWLDLTVRDDGRGFDTKAKLDCSVGPVRGNGLQNIRTRLQELGGRAEIVSKLGGGTTISLHVPLNPK